MSENATSKLMQRSVILSELSKLKEIKSGETQKIADIFKNISNIKDKIFITKIILNEFSSAMGQYEANLGLLLALNADITTEPMLFDALCDKKFTDNIKIHIINALREANSNLKYGDLIEHIENLDVLTDIETQKMIDSAKISIETQIDFLDFFNAVSLNDKIDLLSSLIQDFKSGDIALIASLLAYLSEENDILKMCIEIFNSSLSPVSYAPLRYISNNFDDNMAALANKVIKKLEIKGVIDNKQLAYSDILSNSKPFKAFISHIDGHANFVLFFARKTENDIYTAFSTVFNLKTGIVACFGVENVEHALYQKYFDKIFFKNEHVEIDFNIVASMFEYFADFCQKKSFKIPYEFLVWRQLVYDISPVNMPFEEFLNSNFRKIEINLFEKRKLLQSDFLSTWFFKYGENAHFSALINEISNCNSEFDIKNSINSYFKQIFDDIPLDLMLLFEAYILKRASNPMYNVLFTVLSDNEIKEDFMKKIIINSLIEHFISKYESYKGQNPYLWHLKTLKGLL